MIGLPRRAAAPAADEWSPAGWLVPGILLIAAALRLAHLGAGFWYDEIVNVVEYVRLPARDIISSYAHANHHVLNSLLARASISVLGESAWSVRLPAAGFGIAGVWAFWFVARRIWTRQVAVLATLVMAVSYPHIHYSQMARGYAAFMCLALLAIGCVLRLAGPSDARAERWAGIGYAAAVALGLYSLLLMGFVALGHALVLLAARRWRAIGWLAAGLAGALVLHAPLLPDLIDYYRNNPGFTGNLLFSLDFARELGRAWPLAMVAAASGLVLLRQMIRRDPLFAALVTVPLLLNVLLPWLRGQGVHPRSFMYALPLAHLFVAEGLAWCAARHRALAPLAAAILVLASVSALPGYYSLPKQGFEEALAYVANTRAPSDAVVGLSMAGKAGRFYDPSVVVLEDDEAFAAWLAGRPGPAWILVTFSTQLERDYPRMAEWFDLSTERRAAFEGVVGDGTVYVHWWAGGGPSASAAAAIRRDSLPLIGGLPPVRAAR